MVDVAAAGDGMTLSWTTPEALWLLAVIPLVWMALRVARTNFNPRQRILQRSSARCCWRSSSLRSRAR